MIRILNTIINALFNAMLWPVRELNPWAGMAVVSLFTALALVFIFKLVSNQQKLAAAKKRLISRLLEFAVYKEDIRTSLGAFARALMANALYLRYIMLPLAVCIVPMFFILVQVETRFASRPLRKGETAVIEAQLPEESDAGCSLEKILTSESLEVSAPVVIPALNQTAWRLTVISENPAYIRLAGSCKTFRKDIATGTGLQPIPDFSPSTGQYWQRLLNPASSSIPEQYGIESVHIIYPRRNLSIGLLNINWLIAYIALTLAFGYSFQKLFRITI